MLKEVLETQRLLWCSCLVAVHSMKMIFLQYAHMYQRNYLSKSLPQFIDISLKLCTRFRRHLSRIRKSDSLWGTDTLSKVRGLTEIILRWQRAL